MDSKPFQIKFRQLHIIAVLSYQVVIAMLLISDADAWKIGRSEEKISCLFCHLIRAELLSWLGSKSFLATACRAYLFCVFSLWAFALGVHMETMWMLVQ